jgi:hypothetical protein
MISARTETSRRCLLLHAFLVFSSILKMEAVYRFEKLVHLFQTIRRNIPVDTTLQKSLLNSLFIRPMGTAVINPQIYYILFYLLLCGTTMNLGLQLRAIIFFCWSVKVHRMHIEQ